MQRWTGGRALVGVLCAVAVTGCSFNTWAVRKVADALSGPGGAAAFTADDDPQLVADALPFAIKVYESLIDADPENPALLLTTGSLVIMYANAFVQGPAEILPDNEFETRFAALARAKRLYARGYDYIMTGLELIAPGVREAALARESEPLLALIDEEEIDYLFWLAAGWMAAYSAGPFDFQLIVGVPRAIAWLEQVDAWDGQYSDGQVHDILLSYYAGAPAELGGSREVARAHFDASVAIADGLKAGPYVTLAETFAVQDQDVGRYTELLEIALAIDPAADDRFTLVNVLAQRRARYLLDNIDSYFLLDEVLE